MRVTSFVLVTDGSGNASAHRRIQGRILGVRVEVNTLDTPDIDITDEDDNDILSVNGVAADTLYPILVPAVGTDGAAIDALSTADSVGVFTYPISLGLVTVAISGGGAAKKGTISILSD